MIIVVYLVVHRNCIVVSSENFLFRIDYACLNNININHNDGTDCMKYFKSFFGRSDLPVQNFTV